MPNHPAVCEVETFVLAAVLRILVLAKAALDHGNAFAVSQRHSVGVVVADMPIGMVDRHPAMRVALDTTTIGAAHLAMDCVAVRVLHVAAVRHAGRRAVAGNAAHCRSAIGHMVTDASHRVVD